MFLFLLGFPFLICYTISQIVICHFLLLPYNFFLNTLQAYCLSACNLQSPNINNLINIAKMIS